LREYRRGGEDEGGEQRGRRGAKGDVVLFHISPTTNSRQKGLGLSFDLRQDVGTQRRTDVPA
jgi:hypothetical protein